jgi:ADP-ribose pyrophosphatase YjhB (NUDIX family)
MLFKKNSYCSYCGAAFQESLPWPRRCWQCGHRTYNNPMPVAVILVPVDDGVLVVRRGIVPQQGELALPGGFISADETWQEAGARELEEETGLQISPAEVREFLVRSAPEGMLLVFGLANPRRLTDLPPFVPNDEATERVVLRAPAELAFPLHTEAVQAFFAWHGARGAARG